LGRASKDLVTKKLDLVGGKSSRRPPFITFSASEKSLTLRGRSSPEQALQLVRGVLQTEFAKDTGRASK
jgi:hypothetical protein